MALGVSVQDVFNRPIASAPGAWIDMMERTLPQGDRYALACLTENGMLMSGNIGLCFWLRFATDISSG